MNYVFDIDGTLSFDGVSISREITSALNKLTLNNNQIIFASARPIRDMYNIVPKIKDMILIGGNGAFTQVNEEINVISFSDKVANKIISFIKENDYEYMLDSDWDFTYRGSLNHPLYNNINKDIAKNLEVDQHKSIAKLVIFNPDDKVINFFTKLNIEINYHSNENLIDLSPQKCDKYSALKRLGVDDFIAFGNDANDISLFKNAKYSYCVGDSEYGKHASKVINRDEVALVISKLT